MQKISMPQRSFMLLYKQGFIRMSKYDPLWKWIKENGTVGFQLTYAEIEKIAGVPIDHSFLKFKKELSEYGYQVGKISMKNQTVSFEKTINSEK